MQTSVLVIPQEYVPNGIKTHAPLFDNRPREILRVVVRKEVALVSENLSVGMSFILEARSARKNGRHEEITLPLQLCTGDEKIDTEDEFGRQLHAYAINYFDFIVTWMRAYKSRLVAAVWSIALDKATLRSVDHDEILSWGKDQQSAVLFVNRMIADTQAHMQKIGLEVSVGL